MGCGWHHCGPYWDWHSYPYPAPPPPGWAPIPGTRRDELDTLRDYLRRLEAEMAHVRDRIDRLTEED